MQSSEWKKLRHREALEDFVGGSLEDSRERLLDEWYQLFAEEIEVLVDGFVDDFGDGLVAVKKWAQVDAPLFHEHFNVEFVHDEVCDTVDYLWSPADPDFTATREVSREHPRTVDRQHENFSIHAVFTVHEQVRQIYFERVL